MQPRTGLVGRLLLVRWDATPTTEDVGRVTDAIVAARREAGEPLVVVALCPPDVAIPDEATRREIMRVTPIVDRVSQSHFVAIPGSGTAQWLMRSAMEIVRVLMRKPFTIVASVDEAIVVSARAAGLDPAVVFAHARAIGIITPDEARGLASGGIVA